MEGTKLVLVVAIMLMLKAKGVVGRVYTVGDEEEWSSQANFEAWANSYNFSVGDVLVFKYVKGDHNVYEVKEEAYRWCDATRGGGRQVMGKYESGEDQVELREARKYCFICNIAGHCLGGMRFAIQVLNHTTLSSSSSSIILTPRISSLPPPPFPNSCPFICHPHYHLLHYSIPILLLQLVLTLN